MWGECSGVGAKSLGRTCVRSRPGESGIGEELLLVFRGKLEALEDLLYASIFSGGEVVISVHPEHDQIEKSFFLFGCEF